MEELQGARAIGTCHSKQRGCSSTKVGDATVPSAGLGVAPHPKGRKRVG